jgi:proline iminopeptidase
MWFRRLGYGFLLLVAVPAGTLAAVGGFFAAAFVTSVIPVLVLSGVLTAVLVTGWLSWHASRRLFLFARPLVQQGTAVVVTSGTLLGVSILTTMHVFQPMSLTYFPSRSIEQVDYWNLPTGSRLAFVHIPAEGTPRSTPVVMLHGGPGAPSDLTLHREDQRLAGAGFDVYRYHQVGAGLSERLDDITQYTVDRHVADLEAIRQEIDADRLILVGGSWGGTLAAHYIATHPDRVAQVVFSSPGAIWPPAFTADGRETGSSGNATAIIAETATLRWVVAYALQQINPTAAHNLVPDREMSAFFQHIVGRVIAADRARCNAQHAEDDPPTEPVIPRGFGYYANMMTTASLNRVPDPRPALANNTTPALILRGACDRMQPEVHEEYRDLFTHATLLVVDDVGHAVNTSPQYADILDAFLVDQSFLQEGEIGGLTFFTEVTTERKQAERAGRRYALFR